MDEGKINQAAALRFTEDTKLTTEQACYSVQPTVSRGATTTILAEFVFPSLSREPLSVLWPKGLLTGKARGWQLKGNGLMEGLYELLGGILAQLQGTPAVMRSKAGAARIGSTEPTT